MKNAPVSLFTVMCFLCFVLNSLPAAAEPLKRFGPFSMENPNVRNEIRRSTGTMLEGTGNLWSRLTGLGVRTGLESRNKAVLKRLVDVLHISGEGMPWDNSSGGDEIRTYFDNSKNTQSTSDLILYFYRNHKAYCVPSLYHWTTGLYQPQRMYTVSPASSRHFEALIRSISRQAKKRHTSFRLIDFGGD